MGRIQLIPLNLFLRYKESKRILENFSAVTVLFVLSSFNVLTINGKTCILGLRSEMVLVVRRKLLL